ncbi:putative nuclease HARBI1 [Oreochromis niloticus]|uniref:putative nuclease HARBI1 n=1 Tax=Oreochromis niloticus TaxID=8128 RepID=UPI0009053159|nr:putative nuclease HARBI1 [Oreochromis niloticus]
MDPEILLRFLCSFLIINELRKLCRGRHRRHVLYSRLIRENHIQTRPLYCRINQSVPVLDHFFSQEDPRPDFRLSRESLAVLLNLLNQDRRHGWGATIEILVFLFWLASGASYRVVSRVFGMPRSTVHYIVHRVTKEVLAIRYLVIHLPTTPEDLEVVFRGFAGLARHRAFMKAVGAIDGCHIRIKCPSGPDGQCYRNRKLFPSIILQAVCDHRGRFIDTYVGWPGSVHDSRVLRHSPLYSQSVYPPPVHFILADGGYPCLQRPLPLITPYKRPVQGVGAQRFNSHHSRARSIIERAFGMMKSRFRAIFLQALEVHHTFVPHVITACAILHNICLSAGDIVAPEDEPEEDGAEDDEGDAGLEAVSGALWRDQLSAEVSALEEVPPDHDYC